MSTLSAKVKIIPIEKPFLRVLAQHIGNKCKDDFPDLSDALIVFPTQRNKLYFRRYLLETFNSRGFIPPTMKTIYELMDFIYESCGGRRGISLNTIERNFVLKEVVNLLKVELWKDLSFLRFVAVGNRLLNFFDELSKQRVSLQAIEEKVLAGHYPEKYVKNELLIIRKIYDEYRKRLAETGYHDEIDKYDLIYDQFNADLLKKYNYIAIAGLVATTVVENRVIREILASLPAELILHSCQKDMMKATSTDQPFYLHNKLLHDIGIKKTAVLNGVDDGSVEPAVVHIKRTETISQQTFYLRNLLQNIRTRYEPHRIAIILTDETIVYAVAETLKASGFEFNLSTGFLFTQSILYSFLNQLEDVIENNCHYKKFFAFIKHPLLKNAIVNQKPLRSAIYYLERNMIKNQQNYFVPNDHPEDDVALLVALVKSCIDTVQLSLSLQEYINAQTDMLNKLLSYNHALMEKDSPDIREFFERLNNLAKLRSTGKEVENGVKMLEFILHILKDETFNLRGDPMEGVQVIGILEARNLDFDCIIIPSMNEGVFPKRSEKDLFVNQIVRKEAGLPYDKERENLFYYYFTEMKAGKKEVAISYVEQEKRDIRSRFIDFLVDEGAAIDETKIVLDSAAIKMAKREVKKDHDLFGNLLKKLSGRGLSPTNLRDYKECPYRFYLKYMLHIQEPTEIVEEAGPAEWGTTIHKTLRNFYKYDYPQSISEEDLEEARPLLYKRLTIALKNELAKTPKKVTFLDLEIYKRRLENFLRRDSERFASGFTVVSEKLEKQIERDITISNNRIRLHGYPDRVDMRDNKYYIIDYKSKAPPGKKYRVGDGFVEFQLPLYGFIMAHEHFRNIGGLAYYEISKDSNIIPIVEEKDTVQYLKDFKKMILLPTIQEILDPKVGFYQTDSKEACRYCAYTHLCGVKNV